MISKLVFSVLAICPLSCVSGARAEELRDEQHFAVMIRACDADKRCDWFKRPVDADNELQCQMMAGLQASTAWAMEHKTLIVKEWYCARTGEAYL